MKTPAVTPAFFMFEPARAPVQNIFCCARDSEKPWPAAFLQVMPDVSDLHVMPPRVMLAPYGKTTEPGSFTESVGQKAAPRFAFGVMTKPCNSAGVQTIISFDVPGGAVLKDGVNCVMSQRNSAPGWISRYMQLMLPVGDRNKASSARPEVACADSVRKVQAAKKARMEITFIKIRE